MTSCKIAIIGGGIAGLVAARDLTRAGVDVVLIEARSRLGGRILTVDEAGSPSADGFDLGPSWFWPQMQPALGALVDELGLKAFPQHVSGDVVFERRPGETVQRYLPNTIDQESMRIAGGTGAVIGALAKDLVPDSILLGRKVVALALAKSRVRISMEDAEGRLETIEAEQVLLALPPRLLADTVLFTPDVEPALVAQWQRQPTWMAPHAKFFAVYDRPFWRQQGLSGMGQSMIGPLSEIHDATTASGKAALFGFVGVSAESRAMAEEALLKEACIQQLGRLFGREALTPRSTLLKDWAADPLTATQLDLTAPGHPVHSSKPWVTGAWAGRVMLCGSETSRTEPGYLAGAVEAASRTVQQLLKTV